MGGFLLILILIFLLWPLIMRWMQGFMARRAEDMLRRMAGAPSRKEEQKYRKKTENEKRGRPYSSDRRRHPAKIMNEVAEDVEYTEIVEYSETTIEVGTGPERHQRIYRESQVEDVKYTEIKVSKK